MEASLAEANLPADAIPPAAKILPRIGDVHDQSPVVTRFTFTFATPRHTFAKIMTEAAFQQCINPACSATYAVERRPRRLHQVRQLARHQVRLVASFPVPKKPQLLRAPLGHQGHRNRRPARFLRRLALPRADAVLPHAKTDVVTIGEGRTVLQTGRPAREADGMKPGKLLLQYEGLNPSRQLQRQRHDRRVHPRAHGRRDEGRLRLDRQHLRQPGDVRRLAEMQGIVFIGIGQDRLRQALAGAGLRRADAADPGRLRRLPPPHPPDRRRHPGDRHLPDEQRQPLPPRRAEVDHVSASSKARDWQAAGLDHRPRRKPRATAPPSAKRSWSSRSSG